MLSNTLRSCTAARAGLATQAGFIRPFSALRSTPAAMSNKDDNSLLEVERFITSSKELHPKIVAANLAKKTTKPRVAAPKVW